MADIAESLAGEPITRGARRRGQTRRRLLTAARAVFAREGLEAATIAQITAEADAGFGTFYLHFQTKEDAYRAVVTEGFEELAAALEGVRDALSDAPWYALTQASVRAYVEFAARNRELFTVMFVGGDVGRGLGRELCEHFAARIAVQIIANGAAERDPAVRPWPYPPMPVAIATVSGLTRSIIWWLSQDTTNAADSQTSLETLIVTMSRYVTAALWGRLPAESLA